MKRTLSVVVAAALCAFSALAQEAPVPFTNADVMRLLAAHATEQQVVVAIRDAKVPRFDFSDKAISELGSAGASLSILGAMRQASAAARSSTTVAPDQRSPAGEQTLAGASAEAKKVGHTWEVSTNPGPTTEAASTPAAATKSDTAKSADADARAAADVKGEDYWRKRMMDLRGQLDSDTLACEFASTQIKSLQAALATVKTYDRNGNIVRYDRKAEIVLDGDLLRATQAKAKCTLGISQDRRAIAAAEEEARVTGALPGWLRPR